MTKRMDRRTVLKGAAAGTALYFLPNSAHLRAHGKEKAASDKINMALIGIGGRGGSLAKTFGNSGEVNVVALCDVDMGSRHTSASEKRFPDAKKYQDFRKMFDEMADKIDACQVAVADHSHFPICMLAMSLGKHVYVEKPLCHRFEEAELLMAAEKKYKVACQMGNQGHGGYQYNQFKDYVKAGILDQTTRIDAFMNNPRRWHGWKVDGFPTGEKMPETLNWDIWLGTRPQTPFSRKLHPGNWRSWYRFGNGAFGDWGPHTLDTAHEFLELGLPEKVTAVKRDGPSDWIFPQASTIQFDFPARGKMPPVVITWYDGVKNLPPRPKELEEKRKLRRCGKVIYAGDLVFYGGTHSDTLRLIPESKNKEMASKLPKPDRTSSHHGNFLNACRGEEVCRSRFEISGPLTEMFLLGVIAQHLGGALEFDRQSKKITNSAEAHKLLVGTPPRKGWEEFYKLA